MSIVLLIYPSHTTEDQTVANARLFGMSECTRSWRDWIVDSNQDSCIIITTPGVVYNDIVSGKYTERLKLISAIIADEAHHASCHTWHTIFMALPNVTRSYGFSALPLDKSANLAMNFSGMSIDDAMTISVCGPVIYEKSAKELKDFLNIPKLINLHYIWPKDKWAAQKTSDWHEIRALLYKNTERLSLIASVIRLLIDRDYNTIVHVSEKELGRRIFRLLNSDRIAIWYGGGDVEVSEELYKKIMEAEGVEL
jgi:superfamily II DNA or RNA helicase